MDPLGAAGLATALTLFAGIQITRNLYQELSRLHAAPEDVKALLLDEVGQLQVAFQEIGKIPSLLEESSGAIRREAEAACEKLETLSVAFQKVAKVAEISPNGMCWELQKRGHHLDKLKGYLQSIRRVLTASLDDPTHLPSSQERQTIQQNHELLLIAVSEGSPHDPEKVQQTRRQQGIRPCHIIILLGLLTIVSSLVPAFWRSTARNDISGGFSIAQYILAVGVFIVGGILVVHSKTCTCWSSSSETDGEKSAAADFENKLESLGIWSEVSKLQA